MGVISCCQSGTHTAQSCRETERRQELSRPEEEEKVSVMSVNPQHLHLAEVTAAHFITVWEHFDRHGESDDPGVLRFT